MGKVSTTTLVYVVLEIDSIVHSLSLIQGHPIPDPFGLEHHILMPVLLL